MAAADFTFWSNDASIDFDIRKEFNANTSTDINKKLCDKAIKLGVINLMTCTKNKLSKIHREKRELDEKKACQKDNPVFKKPSKPSVPSTPTPNKPLFIAPILMDDSSDYSSSDESVSSKSSSDSKESITLVVEEILSETVLSEVVVSEAFKSDLVVSEVKSETVLVSEALVSESTIVSEAIKSEMEQSRAILISVSKLIMDITASDDFNISLESSKHVSDMIQKLLNL